MSDPNRQAVRTRLTQLAFDYGDLPGHAWLEERITEDMREAQLRALRFVRNLPPAQIERVIADIEAGRVKL